MCTTTSPTIDRLTLIWQRVLQRSPISVDEDFFDLGGSPKLADALFAEIAAVFDRELPSAMIGYAPTIASLAGLLDQAALPRFSPFVLIKPGSERPPVFIVHGLGGTTCEFVDIARHIETRHAIYGIQAKGIDGLEEPLERIEDMAALYLASIAEIEPDGPYLLIGYSFGGLIAWEMAQRLLANGKQVALLTMLDTYPDPRYLPVTQRLRLLGKRVEYHISEMRRLPFPGPFLYLAHKAGGRLGIIPRDTWLNETNSAGAPPLSFACASARVMQKAYTAMARYRPQPCRGEIRHIVAGTTSFYLPRNPIAIWGHLAAKLEVDTIPGNHVEIVRSRCEALYPILTRHVEGAAPSGMGQRRPIHEESSGQSSSRGVQVAGAGHGLAPASST